MRIKVDDLPAVAATGRGSDSARKALNKQSQTKPRPAPPDDTPIEDKAPPARPPKDEPKG